MSIGFGARARVGHLYPSGGLVDYELQLMAPDGVQFLTTRMPFRATGVADDLALVAELEANARLLADARVELIAFNCTAASLLVGPTEVRRRIAAATGIAAATTIEAVLGALAALNARRVALLTPYPQEVVDREVQHLAECGVEVVATGGPACGTPVEQGEIAPEEWLRLATALDTAGADALLISCAGTRTAEVIEAIERRTGLPVVTSNQALLWLVLTTLDLEPHSPGHGRLLAGDIDPRRNPCR